MAFTEVHYDVLGYNTLEKNTVKIILTILISFVDWE